MKKPKPKPKPGGGRGCKILWLAILMLFLIPSVSFAASSCTAKPVSYGLIELSWTAHTDGTFTSTTCTPVYPINGWVTDVVTDPGATAPQALYDVTLTDKYGVDISAGDLADRSATASEHVQIGGYPVYGPLTLNITSNNVNAAVGTVAIFFVPFTGD